MHEDAVLSSGLLNVEIENSSEKIFHSEYITIHLFYCLALFTFPKY